MKISKKTLSVLLVLLMGAMLFGCATTKFINDDFIIEPDSDFPFQGTWIATSSSSSANTYQMHVINGNSGTYYERISFTGWIKIAVYIINEVDEGRFVTSNNWRIRLDGDNLIVENTVYERYKW